MILAREAQYFAYTTSVTSPAAGYHFDDDWEFTDTQEAGFEFEGQKTIVWQGFSCNGFPTQNRSRGTSIQGTAGSVVVDQDGYTVYDLQNKVVKQAVTQASRDPLAT